MRPGALSGVRVLDFSAVIAGPYCTRLMADLGAEVIKIEAPEGDLLRHRTPLRQGQSTYYGHLNAGKRSICADLKHPEARALMLRLAAASDVVVENFRPGVMARLGLDYASLAAVNPRLVYCSISGYGQEGEGSERPAYAPVVHAASGFDLANLAYQEGLDRPPATGIFVADILAGTNAFGAIQAALFRRERSGEGERIEVTLLASMLNLLVYECQEAQFPAEKRRPVYQPLRARDGFVIVAPISQKNFEAVCCVIGRPGLRTDPRFATGRARERHWDAMMALVEDWTRERDGAECEAAMLAAGVPCSRYRSVAEALQDPSMQRGGLARVQDAAGAFQVPNPPFRFSGSRAEVGPWVADKGQDTGTVLSALLEIDPEPLFAAGVLKR